MSDRPKSWRPRISRSARYNPARNTHRRPRLNATGLRLPFATASPPVCGEERPAAPGTENSAPFRDFSLSASPGSNPAPTASLTWCLGSYERAGEVLKKTPRFRGLCGSAGLAAPAERRRTGERASDAGEFLCRALMHWRNSVDVQPPDREYSQTCANANGPTGPWR